MSGAYQKLIVVCVGTIAIEGRRRQFPGLHRRRMQCMPS